MKRLSVKINREFYKWCRRITTGIVLVCFFLGSTGISLCSASDIAIEASLQEKSSIVPEGTSAQTLTEAQSSVQNTVDIKTDIYEANNVASPIIYDAQGRKIKFTSDSGEIYTYTYISSTSSKLDTLTKYDSSGNLVYTSIYHYDAKGAHDSSKYYDADGKLTQIATYNLDGPAKGWVSRRDYLDQDSGDVVQSLIYTYGDDGKMTQYVLIYADILTMVTTKFNSDGSISSRIKNHGNDQTIDVSYAYENGVLVKSEIEDKVEGYSQTIIYDEEGKRVSSTRKEFDADGNVARTIEYSYSNGNLKEYKIYGADNSLIQTNLFNDNNEVYRREYYRDSVMTRYMEYTFDPTGSQILTANLYNSENDRVVLAYMFEDGKVSQRKYYYDNGDLNYYINYSYDDNGNMVLQEYYNPDDVLTQKDNYNESGKIYLREYFNADGNVRIFVRFTYDENGNLTSGEMYALSGDAYKFKEKTVYYYDDGKIVRAAKYDAENKSLYSLYFFYDAGSKKYEDVYDTEGNLLNTSAFDSSGLKTEYMKYVYDSEGRVERCNYMNNFGFVTRYDTYSYDGNTGRYDINSYDAKGNLKYTDYYEVTGKLISRRLPDGRICTYYDNGALESVTLQNPDQEGNVYYHYIDENYNNQGYGRIDYSNRKTALNGELSYAYSYDQEGRLKTVTAYTDAGRTTVAQVYTYDYYDSGNTKSVTLANPDISDMIKYEYLDEAIEGQKHGRMARQVRSDNTEIIPQGSVTYTIDGTKLIITGTIDSDDINISEDASGIIITSSSGTQVITDLIDGIYIYGFDGDDTIYISSSVLGYVSVFSGEGNDQIYANNQGGSLLSGGRGRDTIIALNNYLDTIIGDDDFDSYWFDSGDLVSNIDSGDVRLHQIDEFYQPFDDDYVSTALDGQNLPDPSDIGEFMNVNLFPLFYNGEVYYNDVQQGDLADCYFLAGLSSLAYTTPGFVLQSITALGDGTYGVRFYRDGVANYLRIDGDVASNQGYARYADFGQGGAVWAMLLEKAYALFKGSDENAYESIKGGYLSDPYAALAALPSYAMNKNIEENFGSDDYLFDWLSGRLSSGSAVTLGSTSVDPYGMIVSHHAYSLQSVESINGVLYANIYNPWGIDGIDYDNDPDDGLLRLTIAELQQYFSQIAVTTDDGDISNIDASGNLRIDMDMPVFGSSSMKSLKDAVSRLTNIEPEAAKAASKAIENIRGDQSGIKSVEYDKDGRIKSMTMDDGTVVEYNLTNDTLTLNLSIGLQIVFYAEAPGREAFIEIYATPAASDKTATSALAPTVKIDCKDINIPLDNLASTPIKFDYKAIKDAITQASKLKKAAFGQYQKSTLAYYEAMEVLIKNNLASLEAEGVDLNGFLVTADSAERIEIVDRAVEAIYEASGKGSDKQSVREFLVFEKQLRSRIVDPAARTYEGKVKDAIKHINEVVESLMTSKLLVYFNSKKEKMDIIINMKNEAKLPSDDKSG